MSVASKNLFDLLGNDDGDSDTPSGPVKTVDKTTTRTTKRNVEPVAPVKPVGQTGTRRPGPGGNEGAFRDKNVGSASNHRKPLDEPARGGARGGRGARERGGRGGRFPRDRDDRHTKSAAHGGTDKQAAQSWGANEGEAEQKDEQAGEDIAKAELKDATAEDAAAQEYAEEPEDKNISYADWLIQQAEKKAALQSEGLEIRKPNEGSKVDKKWANAKPLSKDEEDEVFIAGSGGKAKRERERKAKQVIEIDQRYVEPSFQGRGGRGGPRGGGRGEGRGGRGGRGDFRGGRGGDARGSDAPRGGRGGGRGGASGAINTNDENAFPSLGA